MIDSVDQLGAERTHCKSAMMGWPASVLANSDQRERRIPKLLDPNKAAIYVNIVGSGPLLLYPMRAAICIGKLGENECSLLQLDKVRNTIIFHISIIQNYVMSRCRNHVTWTHSYNSSDLQNAEENSLAASILLNNREQSGYGQPAEWWGKDAAHWTYDHRRSHCSVMFNLVWRRNMGGSH